MVSSLHDVSVGACKISLRNTLKAITHCRDTCRVTTANGKTRAFWERNLRFMTDLAKMDRKKVHLLSCPPTVGRQGRGDFRGAGGKTHKEKS
jgi:hypothetical protein